MANTKTTKTIEKKKTVPAKVEKTEAKKDMKKNVRTLSGTVVSTKMKNTVVVAIERKVAHKLYGKLIRVTKRLKADTNGMDIKEGDVVKIVGTRPLSKDKNYKVLSREEVKK